MDRDWKAAFAAQRRDAMFGEAGWRPFRQSVAPAEPHAGWWWKLMLATLPSLIAVGLLWRAAEPPALSESTEPQRIEVVFLAPAQPEAAVPPPPTPPRIARSPRSLISVPLPQAPSPSVLPEVPGVSQTPETLLPEPSAGDLLRQIEYNAARQHGVDAERLSRHGRPRLPGRAEAFVEGIHVRGRPSPEQRVQFVLGLVGLGQRDPCPGIRRKVRDAIAAQQSGNGIDGELDHWLTRAEHCRR